MVNKKIDVTLKRINDLKQIDYLKFKHSSCLRWKTTDRKQNINDNGKSENNLTVNHNEPINK